MNSLKDAYERVFYRSFPRRATDPDRLSAVASLFGCESPPVESARVLEIGCSDGGNLISLAVIYPRATFVGIDLAELPVARGRELIRQLDLANVSLRQLDIVNFRADAGDFDYIIVHGVFSWVPAEVRTAILRVIQRHLSPSGIAYIDYNAQPGGNLRYAFRESMRYHVRRSHDAQQRIDQARALVGLIIEANPPGTIYRQLAEEEMQRLLRTPDAALFHDSLSERNEPFYFHEFIGTAAEQGLQYLAEADVSEMSDARLPAKVREQLSGIRSLVEKEQYLDILTNRTFRQTLLCRAGRKINRALDGSTLASLFFSSRAELASGASPDQTVIHTVLGTVTTSHPLTKAVVQALVDRSGSRLRTAELLLNLADLESGAAEELEAQLPPILLQLVMSGILEVHATSASFSVNVTTRPLASRLARLQASQDERISTLNHESIELAEPFARRLLPLLDGSRTAAQLAALLNEEEALVLKELRGLASAQVLLREF